MIAPGTERTPPERERRKGKGRRGKGGQASTGEGAPQAVATEAGAAEANAAVAVSDAAPRIDRRPAAPQHRRDQRQGRGRPNHGGQESRPPKPNFKSRPPARKSAPAVPLTNEMKAGKAPLRTFGDLKQFFELKDPPTDAPPASET
jgi:hypothetical protein